MIIREQIFQGIPNVVDPVDLALAGNEAAIPANGMLVSFRHKPGTGASLRFVRYDNAEDERIKLLPKAPHGIVESFQYGGFDIPALYSTVATLRQPSGIRYPGLANACGDVYLSMEQKGLAAGRLTVAADIASSPDVYEHYLSSGTTTRIGFETHGATERLDAVPKLLSNVACALSLDEQDTATFHDTITAHWGAALEEYLKVELDRCVTELIL